MKQYCLKIESKNKKSLKNFLRFFFKYLKTKFSIIKKSSANPTIRKIITFLKSPHVNKTAQEHFETHLFTKKVLVKEASLEKSLIFLKKVLIKLFQDISIRLEFLTNEKTNKKNSLLLFSPNNIKLLKKTPLKKNLKRQRKKIILKNTYNKKNSLSHLTNFLNIVSISGEILMISSLKK